MDYNHGRNSWSVWMHPLLTAYYYYYTAKADLFNQSVMGRRNPRVKKIHTHPMADPALPVGANGYGGGPPGGGGGGNDMQLVVHNGGTALEVCPQCKLPYDQSGRKILQESCGHQKCKACVIANDECPQCLRAGGPLRIANGPGGNGLNAEFDPMPPRLVAEEPYPGLGPSHIRELPNDAERPRGAQKRKSRDPMSAPSKFNRNVGSFTVSADKSPRRRTSTTNITEIDPAKTYLEGNNTAQVETKRSARIESRKASLSSSNAEEDGNRRASAGPSTSFARVSNSNPSSSKRTSFEVSISPTKLQEQKGTAAKTVQDPGAQQYNSDSSNSGEACDPLGGTDESNSAENDKATEVIKKKKKRNPVTIHDHITVLSGDPPLYQCNVCLKKFKTKAHIKYHEFCQNGEKPFKCGECGQGFIAKSHYEYHLRTHTGERPYVCPKCGKGFNQRGKVTRHMRSHTGEKPFICQQCGRGFANAQALRSHFLIHTGERPFACQYCNKRFTGMTNLKKHVITHTGERPFTCNHCGKSFGLKWTLDLHLRTHSTERPYACDQCTRAFSNSKDLRRHLVIHSGERPFKCWICGTAFRRKDNLDRHIKNTHNQPKEVAKQLANEAAADYMAKQNQANLLKQTTKKAPQPAQASKSGRNAPSPGSSKNPKKKVLETIQESDVVITADISPADSPANMIGNADALDTGPSRSAEVGTGTRDDSIIEGPTVTVTSVSRASPVYSDPKASSSDYSSESQPTLSIFLGNDGTIIREPPQFTLNPVTNTPTYVLDSSADQSPPKVNEESNASISKANWDVTSSSTGRLMGSNPRYIDLSTDKRPTAAPGFNYTVTLDPRIQTHRMPANTVVVYSNGPPPRPAPAVEASDSSEGPQIVSYFSVRSPEARGTVSSTNEKGCGTSDPELTDTEADTGTEPSEDYSHDPMLQESGITDDTTLSLKDANQSTDSYTDMDALEKDQGESILPDSDFAQKSNDLNKNGRQLSSGCNSNERQKIGGGIANTNQHLTLTRMNDASAMSSRSVDVGRKSASPRNPVPASSPRERPASTSSFGNHKESPVPEHTKSTQSQGPATSTQVFPIYDDPKTMDKGTQCIPPDSLLTHTGYVIKQEVNMNTNPEPVRETGPVATKSIQVVSGDERGIVLPLSTRCTPTLRQGGSPGQYIVTSGGTQKVQGVINGSSPVNHIPEPRKLPGGVTLAYVQLPTEAVVSMGRSVPTEARLVYTNSNIVTQGTSQANAFCHAANEMAAPQLIGSSGKYRFAYSPEISSTSAMTQYESQPSFKFVYPNGDQASDTDSSDSMRVVYACAAAQADGPTDGGEGRPQKLKLLYAEALGVGTPDDSGHVQLMYTAAAPNQNINPSPNQNVEIYAPAIIRAGGEGNAENVQMLFAQQPRIESHTSSPVPVEVMYNGNGTVMAQTVYHPQDLSWIRRDLHRSSQLQAPMTGPPLALCGMRGSLSSPTFVVSSRKDMVNHHNYTTAPIQPGALKRVQGSTTYEVSSDGLQTLARAATTRISYMEQGGDSGAKKAAAAIAQVGRLAEQQRPIEIMEAGAYGNANGSSRMSQTESIPHRGPRKHYLSQLSNSPK